MTHTDQSRAEFEKWARGESPSINLTREGNGYRYSLAETLYDAWHASRAAIQQSSGVELPEPFGYWHQGPTEDESDFFYHSEFGDVSCATCLKLYTEQQVRALLASAIKESLATAPSVLQGWMPIESAPKDKTLLLGYRNSHGHWRTLRGEWFTQEEIDEYWEDPEGVEPGWFETSVEADDIPNVWRTEPTHWMSLPQPPKEQT